MKQKELALFPPFWPPTECIEVKNTPGTWPGDGTAGVTEAVAAPGAARRPGEYRAERPPSRWKSRAARSFGGEKSEKNSKKFFERI